MQKRQLKTYWKNNTLKQIEDKTEIPYEALRSAANELGIEPISNSDLLLKNLFDLHEEKTLKEIIRITGAVERTIRSLAKDIKYQ